MIRCLSAIIVLLLLLSCEDTKKTAQPKKTVTATTTEILKDTIPKIKESIPEKITPENVIEFLTEYGKENPETKIKITTYLGNIEIELYNDTPLHRANFIRLVKENYFEETFFHRVVPEFIIQGGNSDNRNMGKKRVELGNTYLIPAEIKRKHFYGSISGAKEYRDNPGKETAPFEFFIFLGKPFSKKHLDGNYTVFGRVTKGMNIVEKIANIPADGEEWPIENIYISTEIIE